MQSFSQRVVRGRGEAFDVSSVGLFVFGEEGELVVLTWDAGVGDDLVVNVHCFAVFTDVDVREAVFERPCDWD